MRERPIPEATVGRLPVIEIDGVETFEYEVEAAALREVLEATGERGG